MKSKITPDMLLRDVFTLGDENKIAEVLFSFGMHCIGCALAHGETVEDAAAVHGVDPQVIIDELEKVID